MLTLVVDAASGHNILTICEPATRYYGIMTRFDGMPTLIGEVI